MDAAQERIALPADIRDWPDAYVEAMRDHAPSEHVRAACAEEWSQRVERRNISLADVYAAMAAKAQEDAALAQAITRMLRVERKRLVPSLKPQAYTHAERLCHYANAPGGPVEFREAGEMLKRYCREEITGQELCDAINANLIPKLPNLCVDTIDGRDVFSIDDDGWSRATGWQYLAQCVQEGVILTRFRLCLACGELFFDASRTANKKDYCYSEVCQRKRKRHDQQRHRQQPT